MITTLSICAARAQIIRPQHLACFIASRRANDAEMFSSIERGQAWNSMPDRWVYGVLGNGQEAINY